MKDLFGNELLHNGKPIPKTNPVAFKQHHQLIQIHGESKGNICGNCIHFYEKHHSKTYFKCEKAKNSSSPLTDWRKRWVACGLFVSSQPDAITT